MRINTIATMDSGAMIQLIGELLPHVNTVLITSTVNDIFDGVEQNVLSLRDIVSKGLDTSLEALQIGQYPQIAETHMLADLANVIVGNSIFTREV